MRSFVRSYAKALKIPDAHILAALESTEADIYDSDLIKLRNPDTASEEYSVKRDKVEVDSPKTIDLDSLKADTYQEEIDSNEEEGSPKEKPIPSSSAIPEVSTTNALSSTDDPINRGEPVGLSLTFLTGVEGGLVKGSRLP